MTISEVYKKADELFPQIENDSARFSGWVRVVTKNGSEFHIEEAYITFIDQFVVVFSWETRPLVFHLEEVSAFSSGEKGEMC